MRIAPVPDNNGDDGPGFVSKYTRLRDGTHRLRLVSFDGSPLSLPGGPVDPPPLAIVRSVPADDEHQDAGPFGLGVPCYQAAGWGGTLPLPPKKKNPPPVGFTGRKAPYPSRDQLAKWLRDPRHERANICIRLAGCDDEHEVIGIDVDHYVKGGKDKRGGDQLRALEDRLGGLPDTWISSARADGISGIRYYRVPRGLAFRGQVDKDIEAIFKGYRFAVVWPSTNPDAGGSQYSWFPPGVRPSVEGRAQWNGETDSVPRVADLPLLPDSWIEHLTTGTAPDDGAIDMESSVDEIYRWADDTFNAGDADTMCARVAQSVATIKTNISDEATSHDKIVSAHAHLYSLAAEGHVGWKAAVADVEAHYSQDVKDREKRGRSELRGEIFRSGTNALRKVKVKVDQAHAIGARYTPPECTCSTRYNDLPKWIGLSDVDGNLLETITFGGSVSSATRSDSILTVLGPAEWAGPVPSTEFLISKVLCADTFGVNAGPKKSLKTHDNQAIAFAVATGTNLYCNPLFPVRRTGTVLYIVGEGGVTPVRRTLHRMARAYGLNPADVARDPDFGLIAAFGAAPIDADAFRDELRRLLDRHQPELVLIESFYNFHPKDVEASNLFSRGQVIDGHHKFVRNECEGATSIMTDHYRSTGGKSLDLDNISMAGQAENADSWITRIHHQEPNVADGEFVLHTGFGSRQWGGTEWQIDWHLGPFDHDSGHHVGEISWDVSPAHSRGSTPRGGAHGRDADTSEGRRRLLCAYVDAHPETSKTAAIEQLSALHRVGEKNFRVDFQALVDAGGLVSGPVKVTVPYGDATREKTVNRWKRGDFHITRPARVGVEHSDTDGAGGVGGSDD